MAGAHADPKRHAPVSPFFLAIEGPIGVGKTTLARLLQPRFDADVILEAFEENPFLSDFYGDRARYAFQTQMFFLLSRYRQQQSIPSLLTDRPVISDYTFGKDSLFARLNLEGDELNVYQRLYAVLEEQTAFPDLVIYLQADTDVLMARIAARDRPYERRMERDYIAAVSDAYVRYFADYTDTPVLTLDTNDLNYVQDASALALVETKVREALGVGSYQQTLPQMERAAAATVRTAAPEGAPRSRRDLLDEFLDANEAVARVGALLGRTGSRPSQDQLSSLQTALRDALERLASLADAAELDLEWPSS